MIAPAYLVLMICSFACNKPTDVVVSMTPITSQLIPQPSMDQCIRQANAFNTHRKDTRAMCVPGSEK